MLHLSLLRCFPSALSCAAPCTLVSAALCPRSLPTLCAWCTLWVRPPRHGDKKGDLKDLLVDYEAKVAEAHDNLKEGGTRDQEEARGATQSGEGGEGVEDEGRQGQADAVGAEEDAGQGHGEEADGMEVDEEQAGASAVPAAAAAAGAAANGARGANTGVAPEHGRKAVPVAAAAVVVKPEPGVGGAPKGPVAKTAAAAGGRAERSRARTTQVRTGKAGGWIVFGTGEHAAAAMAGIDAR